MAVSRDRLTFLLQQIAGHCRALSIVIILHGRAHMSIYNGHGSKMNAKKYNESESSL
jgi:hypothetical protein